MAWDGPKWGREDLFPANPDLADIRGRTDLDLDENVHFVFCWGGPKLAGFQVPTFWISQNLDFPKPITLPSAGQH